MARGLALRARRAALDAAAALLRPRVEPGAIVAICHCHHAELVPELAVVLRRLPRGTAFHLTSSQSQVFDAWAGRRLPGPVAYRRTENRGRDLRPFFEVARGLDLRPGTTVLKLHGKKSGYTIHGDRWRRDLLRGLVPDAYAATRARARFSSEARLGILGPPGSFISHPAYWGLDRDAVRTWLAGVFGPAGTEDELGFFAGSMFWIRADLLAALLPHVDLDAFEGEPLPRDGTYAHAIERGLAMAARRMGWDMAEVGRPAPVTPEAVRARKLSYF